MALSERITVAINFVTSGATSALGNLRTSIGQADGAVGKFKVAGAAAMDTVKMHAGALAVAGGAALVTFGRRAVTEFTDSALAVGRFSDATGLGAEAASRWVSVADDLGVDAGRLEAAFLRLNREIGNGSPVAEEYGLTLQRTADGAADVNGTMLEAIRVVGGIVDPTERAAAAQQLFGRSYADVAEIILGDADEIAAALASTSDAQVFDDDEIQKARDYRAAMDNFGDVLVDVTNTFGEAFTPAATEALTTLADLARVAQDLKVPELIQKAAEWSNPVAHVRRFTGAVDTLWSSITGAEDATDDLNRTQAVSILGHQMLADAGGAVAAIVDEVTDRVAEQAEETDAAARAVADLEARWDSLEAELAGQRAALDMADQFDALEDAAVTAYVAAVEGSADAVSAARDHERAIIDTKAQVAEYAREVLALPPEAITDVLALIDQGKLEEAERKLAALARAREAIITPSIASGGGNGSRYLAAGGIAGTGGAVAGENFRAELVAGRLITGPTAVRPGQHVTGEDATARMLAAIGGGSSFPDAAYWSTVGETIARAMTATMRQTERAR